jgi:hypothetical protein
MMFRGFGGMSNDKTNKVYGINSLGVDCFNNLGARAIGVVGTAQPSGPGVMPQKALGSK